MHLSKSKKKIYFYIILFFLLTTIINLNLVNIFKKNFLINSIQINSNNNEINPKIMDKIKYVLNKNIFSVKKEILYDSLYSLQFLENISIKKKYPSSIIVFANKTEFIATTYLNQKKYYIGENGKITNAYDFLSEDKLPIIFGKFKASEYITFINILKKHGIKIDKINKFYFHKNKRWDLYFDNNILVKLPSKETDDALKLYNNFIKEKKLKSKMIIDLRIPQRIITSYE